MKNKAIKLLESAHLRQTAPRLAILQALLAAEAPLTREQIARRIGADAPNKTTIYRTLTHLIETNLVHQAYFENRTGHYELAHNCGKYQCHPHFTCSECLQTKCLTETVAPVVQLPRGFKMHRQQIHIEGVCPDCQTKSPKTAIKQSRKVSP